MNVSPIAIVCMDAGAGRPDTVSYTHLRAHETLVHLVCRLLLEKNLFLMIRRPPRSTPMNSSAASDVYKRQAMTKLLDNSKMNVSPIAIVCMDAGAGRPDMSQIPVPAIASTTNERKPTDTVVAVSSHPGKRHQTTSRQSTGPVSYTHLTLPTSSWV